MLFITWLFFYKGLLRKSVIFLRHIEEKPKYLSALQALFRP